MIARGQTLVGVSLDNCGYLVRVLRRIEKSALCQGRPAWRLACLDHQFCELTIVEPEDTLESRWIDYEPVKKFVRPLAKPGRSPVDRSQVLGSTAF
jgi:hypothetical protein